MKEIVCRDGEIAIVDDDQFEELSKYNWYLNKGYPCHCIKRTPYRMHYYVLGEKRDSSLETHHKNENKLDNRMENLLQIPRSVHYKQHKNKFNVTQLPKGNKGYIKTMKQSNSPTLLAS
jgi:hypothetical protein